ncbi:MAG: hypothetical protein Q8P50_12930 [Bacillota bacterium]|nr:hypothetical protein [Bacillota bacterium]
MRVAGARTLTGPLFLMLLAPLLFVIAGCGTRFTLQALNPESIPAEVRDGLPLPLEEATEIVWRAFYQESGWYVAACTYAFDLESLFESPFEFSSPASPGRIGPRSCYSIALYTPGADGNLKCWGSSGGSLPPERFSVGGGRGGFISARGLAFHPRAAKVIGTTSTGRTVECRVVNGFWGLLVVDAQYDEWWTSVDAVDAFGRILFSYWDGKSWRVGN